MKLFSLYNSDNLLSGQAESYAIIWFAFGTKHRGMYINSKYWNLPIVKKLASAKCLPIFRIAIVTATSLFSTRYLFQIVIFGLFLGVKYIDGKFSKIVIQRGLYNI